MAAWIEFSGDWDHRPHPSEVHAFKAGSRVFVPQPVADAAVAAGKAAIIDRPDDLKTTKSGGVEPAKSAPVQRAVKET